jgi:rod shape determining protein RodA
MFNRDIWRHFDFWLFGTVIILSIFGIAMIRSAIAGNTELATYVTRQIVFISLGLVVIFVTAMIDYHYWASIARLMYIATFILLMVVYIIGQASFGAARWISAGIVNIQPSEIGKVVLILVLADYFSRTRNAKKNVRWVIGSLLITLGLVIWIILQPNLSTSIVMFVIWFSLIWISGLPPRYIIAFVIFGAVGIALAFPLLEPYQQQRIIQFIAPEQNARYGNSYNIEQALISIGSGGLLGQGYGHGTQVQLRFLKVRHTDFIFSAMAEEFGFVGTVVIIALLIFVILRCMRAGNRAADPFGALIAYSFGILMFFQTAVNIGVNLKLMPVTGLTLPFVSYGGSSLLSMVLGVGLVESVVLRQKSRES